VGQERSWTLPDGETAEQCGARRADLILAWSEENSPPVDQDRIRSHWPGSENARPIGINLFLVSGVEAVKPPGRAVEESAAIPADSPRGRADRALVEARETGDPARIAPALADLGLACLQSGDVPRGIELIEEALVEARRSDSADLESHILVDLGVAALSSRQPGRARQVLESALALARSTGNRFSEKAALDRLGQAFMVQGDFAVALDHFERALSIAVGLDDSSHQAELLWRIGLQHAELGRRDRALALAGAAVDRMRRLGKPQAAWYQHHLEDYRNGGATLPRSSPSPIGATPATGSDPQAPNAPVAVATTPHLPPESRGPGPLRMALTAIGSMAKFLGSGFQTTTAEVYQERLATCAPCDHHTGLRCRLCGCFTATKAHLLHERCPIGKWPS
jgi:tetratricopeptide (TPR) repeat protein